MRGKTAIEIISKAIQIGASDVHIVAAHPLIYRVNGTLMALPASEVLSQEDTRNFGEEMIPNYSVKQNILDYGQADFTRSFPGLSRVRINIYIQGGSWAAALRLIPLEAPALSSLGLPSIVAELATQEQGLILVTGATGSGKSTTLAGMIDYINHSRNKNIITLEDPIEFLYSYGTCIVNQREVGSDTSSFTLGLRAALRQDPDIIMVGEMRDLETISIAITAAETGHLILASLHSGSAIQTLERIIGAFPSHQQFQIRLQLATSLLGIISQQLIPASDGNGRLVAAEILITNPAIRNLIRENKMHQIYSAIQTGSSVGMISMHKAVKMLYQQNKISYANFNKYGADSF